MATQKEKAEIFAKLHVKGNPLILFNIWDAGSAIAVAESSAKAIATGSAAVSSANGFADGENVPLRLVIENAERIVRSIDLPVTIDFEGGYAAENSQLSENIKQIIDTGAVGINFEDQIVGGKGLYPVEVQMKRIETIRKIAENAGIPFFINARNDIFLKTDTSLHTNELLDEAIFRAESYAKAGASGFFAIGLRKAEFI